MLPLFPLGSVLFPGATLRLHVFERRYRRMVAACLEASPPEFVVLLIKEGDEVVEGRAAAVPAGRGVALPRGGGRTSARRGRRRAARAPGARGGRRARRRAPAARRPGR